MESVDVAAFSWAACCIRSKKYVFFWFYRSVGLEGKIKYITVKTGLASVMEWVDVAAFTFAT